MFENAPGGGNMKRTKLRILLFLLFIGGLILIPQKSKAAEAKVEAVPVNISVKYGQTEARTILDMINEARTNLAYAWYWDKTDTNRIPCPGLEELQYDYDLERVAMKRAAEIALSYDHERPIGGKVWDIYDEENIEYRAVGENIAVAQKTASDVNFGWREDNEKHGGQGHRRNMLSYNYNCVGIGHVYYNNVNYWVEVFAYRPKINTTEVSANDSTQTVSVSVDKTKIEKVDVTFDQDSYSLRIGESTTPAIKETRIYVTNFRSYGRGLAPVLDTPVISVADSLIVSYSNNKLSSLKEGTTNLTATLYGVTSSTSPPISVHDCKNHWDAGSITKTPTCTEVGEKTFTCSICKKTQKTEIVPATGHTYESTWTTDVAATCEKAGTESRHCKNCTAKIDERNIPGLGGHLWTYNENETASCSRCTATHTHEWDSGEITTKPTCTTKEKRTKHCTYTNCKLKKIITLKALGHDYNPTQTDPPTCENAGIIHYVCSRCSDTKTDQDTEHLALGHSWIDNGNETATCSREGCGKKHTHKLDSGKITTKPTCTVLGTKEYSCTYTNCSYVKTETLEATGHKNTERRNYRKPTCTAEGYTGDTYCKDCDTLLSTGKTTAKFDHDWNSGVTTKKATCIEEGIVTYTCENENCGATETIKIPKIAHNYKEEKHQNATCAENGYKVLVCQTCKDMKTEKISATGHSKKTRNKKTASCKAEGYTGDVYCRNCNIVLENGKTLPKLEHQWSNARVTKQATYTAAGELTYHCTKCGTKKLVFTTKLAYPKAGTTYTISGNQYKVVKPGAEVSLVNTSKTTKNVTVPAQIYVQGITYKVTSVGAKAFNNSKKLTKVTLGTNITKINNNAFFNCKNLKTVAIKSVLLTTKTANKKAFKNTHKKLVIQAPKKVKKNYKKIFKGLKVK